MIYMYGNFVLNNVSYLPIISFHYSKTNEMEYLNLLLFIFMPVWQNSEGNTHSWSFAAETCACKTYTTDGKTYMTVISQAFELKILERGSHAYMHMIW